MMLFFYSLSESSSRTKKSTFSFFVDI